MCPFFLIFRTGIALKKETVFDCKNKDVKLMSKVAIIEILSLILILGFSCLQNSNKTFSCPMKQYLLSSSPTLFKLE